jgi:hypothetical protein
MAVKKWANKKSGMYLAVIVVFVLAGGLVWYLLRRSSSSSDEKGQGEYNLVTNGMCLSAQLDNWKVKMADVASSECAPLHMKDVPGETKKYFALARDMAGLPKGSVLNLPHSDNPPKVGYYSAPGCCKENGSPKWPDAWWIPTQELKVGSPAVAIQNDGNKTWLAVDGQAPNAVAGHTTFKTHYWTLHYAN